MNVNEFFELFLIELNENKNLQNYYKFLNDKNSFDFRKAYFCQRLQYIYDNIENNSKSIWDCGCGFGTTSIFLALNNIPSTGSTLEFYFKEIPKRLDFWKKYGNINLFKYNYENVFDFNDFTEKYDIIILQDTLHHLEPLDKAINILNNKLNLSGKILLIEENGNNIIQRLKLFKQRGNKKVIEIYDENLKKNILLGNENIRSLKKWKSHFEKEGLFIEDKDIQYIRFYPPFNFKNNNLEYLIEKEQNLWKNNSFLKEYFFFGLNFIAYKK